MKHFTSTLAITTLVSLLGTAAFAMDMDPAKMTCAEFTAMSPADQMAAMDSMRAAKMKASDGTTSTTTTTTTTEAGKTTMDDPAMMALTKACADKGDALAMDQMAPM